MDEETRGSDPVARQAAFEALHRDPLNDAYLKNVPSMRYR